jgi:hypothetical protein
VSIQVSGKTKIHKWKPKTHQSRTIPTTLAIFDARDR